MSGPVTPARARPESGDWSSPPRRPRGGRILGERTRPPLRGHQPAGADPPPPLLPDEPLALAVIAAPEGAMTCLRASSLECSRVAVIVLTARRRGGSILPGRLRPRCALARPTADALDRLVDHLIALGEREPHERPRRAARIGR